MFNPTRDQARQFFFDTWRKYRDDAELNAMEQTALHVIVEHPEYHALLEDERALTRDYTPQDGGLNPFLHLSLHLALEEQLSINQPPGIRGEYERLVSASGTAHDAKHVMLECLAETIWQAQRTGAPPDAHAYLETVAAKFRK